MSDHGEPGVAATGGGQGTVAHHFEDAQQQFSSSKLGMWVFLATELLMFGGLFTGYAMYRANHPEIFEWAHVFLDRRLGALNTVILITSSLTMALAVSAAQRGHRKRLVLLLGLTFLGACGFLGIKFIEYRPKFEHGLLWGRHYAPDPGYVAHHYGDEGKGHGKAEEKEQAAAPVDLERGRSIMMQTCASCHGKDLRGLPNNGVNLLTSEFVGSKSDEELLTFVKVGRQPFDPASRTKVQMPPRGGNPALNDDMLRDTIAYLRTVWTGPQTETATAETPPAAADTTPSIGEEDIPHSVLPPAAAAPAGLAPPPAPHPAFAQPRNVQHFFGIYFLMTGLHAIHVIAGMVVIGWLIVGALRGRFGPEYFTPVDLVGLFWHLVDLIWIFLFPLFYLI